MAVRMETSDALADMFTERDYWLVREGRAEVFRRMGAVVSDAQLCRARKALGIRSASVNGVHWWVWGRADGSNWERDRTSAQRWLKAHPGPSARRTSSRVTVASVLEGMFGERGEWPAAEGMSELESRYGRAVTAMAASLGRRAVGATTVRRKDGWYWVAEVTAR